MKKRSGAQVGGMGLMVLLSALLTTVPDCDTVVSVDVHHSRSQSC